MKTVLMAGFLLLALSGCANFTSPARSSTLADNTLHWLDYDATRRGALVMPGNASIKTCAEPSPDAALTMVTKLEASSTTGTGADAKERTAKTEFNSTVVDLARRTQTVAFLRESLFRLCEQSLNNKFTPTEVLAAYKEVIAVAQKIAEADDKAADAKVKNAEARMTASTAVLRAIDANTDQSKTLQILRGLPSD
jgi:hypothetical protein